MLAALLLDNGPSKIVEYRDMRVLRFEGFRRGGKERIEMKVDTKSRHRTKAGGNVFLDLGVPPAEAKRLQCCQNRITMSCAVNHRLSAVMAPMNANIGNSHPATALLFLPNKSGPRLRAIRAASQKPSTNNPA